MSKMIRELAIVSPFLMSIGLFSVQKELEEISQRALAVAQEHIETVQDKIEEAKLTIDTAKLTINTEGAKLELEKAADTPKSDSTRGKSPNGKRPKSPKPQMPSASELNRIATEQTIDKEKKEEEDKAKPVGCFSCVGKK